MLTTLAIATVVSGLLLIIMVNTQGLFYKHSSKVEQGLSVNDALGHLQQSIRESSQVAVSYTTSSKTYTSGISELVLKIPSLDSSGSMIPQTFDHFVFLKSGNKLEFKVFPSSASNRGSQDRIFSTKVDYLLFEYFDLQNPPQQVQPNLAKKIRVTLKLRQKAGADIEENIATSEANLRND